MDAAEVLAEKKFIGSEFLTWLFWRIQHSDQLSELDPLGSYNIQLDQKIECGSEGDDGSVETVQIQGQYSLHEAYTALAVGKQVTALRLQLKSGENETSFTLKNHDLSFYQLKTPKAAPPEEDEDVDGRFYEKIFYVTEAVKAVDMIFRSFISLRTSDKWSAEVDSIQAWIKQAARRE